MLRRIPILFATCCILVVALWFATAPPRESPGTRPTPELPPVMQSAPRSGHWPKVRALHLLSHPACEACGATHDGQVHHVQPYHLHPELELVESNLITLCGPHGCNAHFRIGHVGNWKNENPHVRDDAARERERRRVSGQLQSFLNDFRVFSGRSLQPICTAHFRAVG